ncbi:MAG: cytidine deaminase [Saprospiraceae bacterium]|nr:cytidine deaminase [Saprospiraceae bacterium]MDW8483673.1 cytidine deaminase [Saprospiraceae bacterium]
MQRTCQIFFFEYDRMDALVADEQQLLQAAHRAVEKAYAPYSRFRVGAAAWLSNKAVVSGANFENAAYPMCLCAERATLAAAFSQYPNERIVALAVVAVSDTQLISYPVTPCGACRQVLLEVEQKFGHPIRLILRGQTGPTWVFARASDLLPLGFDAGMMRLI